jgi:hypothetical protein
MTKSNLSKAELRRKAEARLSKKKDKTQPVLATSLIRRFFELIFLDKIYGLRL